MKIYWPQSQDCADCIHGDFVLGKEPHVYVCAVSGSDNEESDCLKRQLPITLPAGREEEEALGI